MAHKHRRSRNEGFSLRYLLFHPALWFVAGTMVLIVSAMLLWQQYSPQWVDAGQFSIEAQSVVLNQAPEGFPSNLPQRLQTEVFADRSLLDTDLVPATASFLSLVPWVQHVKHVQKSSLGLQIEVDYRLPVASIHLPGAATQFVDGDGFLFDPSQMTTAQSSVLEHDLLKIAMPKLSTAGLSAWRPWPDHRIAHAAALSRFIAPRTKELKLYWVVSFDMPTGISGSGTKLELWTKNGTRVRWGSAPGYESSTEATAAQKLNTLVQFIEQQGELPNFDDRNHVLIDVSTGIARLIDDRRVASSANWLPSLNY